MRYCSCYYGYQQQFAVECLISLVLLQISHSNIPEDVLFEAREAYQIVRTDFTENRKLISKASMWKLIVQFCSFSMS